MIVLTRGMGVDRCNPVHQLVLVEVMEGCDQDGQQQLHV